MAKGGDDTRAFGKSSTVNHRSQKTQKDSWEKDIKDGRGVKGGGKRRDHSYGVIELRGRGRDRKRLQKRLQKKSTLKWRDGVPYAIQLPYDMVGKIVMNF